MRSSKSRSRSKSNRPRTLGNITNRVFDSSGPEGKVRGTPQQIIDKYLILARDAQLSNDRVNAENFLQHAEHYTRMLAEAMREMQAEQDQRRQQDAQNQQQNQQRDNGQQRERQQERLQDRGDGQQPDLRDDRGDDRREPPREERREERRDDRRDRGPQPASSGATKAEVIEIVSGDDDSNLVETPEARRPPRHRPARNKRVEDGAEQAPAKTEAPTEARTEEAPKPERGPRKPRAPRKPKTEGEAPGSEAAE